MSWLHDGFDGLEWLSMFDEGGCFRASAVRRDGTVAVNDLFDSVAKTLAPIYNFTAVRAIREGMYATVPLLVVGSLALILFQLPVEALANAVATSDAVPHLAHVYTSAFQITAIVAAAGIAASWARSKQLPGAPAAAIAIALLLINMPDYVNLGDGGTASGLDKTWLSGQGMTNAIISGTITGALYCPVMRALTKGKDDVPFGTVAIYACVPGAAILFIGFVWYVICDKAFGITPVELHYRFLQAPFALTMSDGFGDVLTWSVFKPLLWWFGVHGATVVGSAASAISTANLLTNADIFQKLISMGMTRSEAIAAMGANGAAVYSDAFMNAFEVIGGCGITFGLCVSLIVFSKSTRNRVLGIIGIVLSFFNINEPVLFCIVLFNPAMLIPFILVPAISTTLAYVFTVIGFLPYSTGVTVPWTTPAVISGFLMGGGSWAFLQLIILAISCVVYAPFVMITDRLAYSEDHDGKIDGYGGKAAVAAGAGVPGVGAQMPGAAAGAYPGAAGQPFGYGQVPGQYGQPGQPAGARMPGQQPYGQAPGARPDAWPSGQAPQPGAGNPQEFSGDFAGFDPETGRPIYK